MEPTYYDKTQDYPADHPDNKYLLTAQNVGVTLDKNGKKVIVPEDIRNGNGRAIRAATGVRTEWMSSTSGQRYFLADEGPDLPPVLKSATAS
jgi:phosphoenolpyruvate carboxykinase (ATP)